MSFDTDAWLERRRLARRLNWWRSLAVLAVVALFLGALYWIDPGNVIQRRQDHVARFEIEGIITQNDWWMEKLQEIEEDDRARALIVYINSPGGSTYGGEALFTALRRVAEKKPTVAVIGTLGASAGYMAAIAADRVFARETSLTGSIGVLFQTAEFSQLLAKLGIGAESIASGELKDEPSPIKPLSPAGREQIRRMVMETHEWFVNLVAERRQMPREKVAELADGRVYSGRLAAENGLIDALGGVEEARRWLAQSHGIPSELPLRDVPPEPPRDGWEALAGRAASMVFGKSLLPERLKLDGLVSVWHPE
ncbi:MAG TPA: signal peptide peptidase SppA [Ferrovibrio sp.]|jgi:protease-4|uniref:signal peptide peptidase SppA n=1 Tax=Ferrovibrio sp. TaxID=1917215 RepID=UPI002B4B26D9|nr:signal peptide peptidase SppA [Ferrovibrio sp.]HLT79364.1 signal peptide peptidase SppA [Ferrovibrio sp.]